MMRPAAVAVTLCALACGPTPRGTTTPPTTPPAQAKPVARAAPDRPGALAINADFNEINKGFGAMLGAGIDYDGASGPLDFELATGDAPAEVQAWCVAGTRAFARAGRVREGELIGELECR